MNPGAVFMHQMALLLTDPVDGFLRGKRFLIIDRDGMFSPAFRQILKDAGIRILLTPPSAPNCNAIAERWIRGLRDEVLNRMIFFGPRSLHRTLAAYEVHFRTERNHQGIGNVLIEPDPGVGSQVGAVQRRERLGGLLSYYHRHAA